MKTLPEQLHAAMVAKGWTVEQLLSKSGLECSRPSLQRKLRGEQKLDVAEIQALVDVLDVNVVAVPSRGARAS